MFNFFKRQKPAAKTGTDYGALPLYFKDGPAAFEYACKYMASPLEPWSCLAALVVDARKLFGTAAAVKVQTNGVQLAAVRVPSPEGGFVVAANTLGPKGPLLQPGQLVAWQVMEYSQDIAKRSPDPRFGWVGVIVGTLKPEWVAGRWSGDERFSG